MSPGLAQAVCRLSHLPGVERQRDDDFGECRSSQAVELPGPCPGLDDDVLLAFFDWPDVIERVEEHSCQVIREVEVAAGSEFLYAQQLAVGDSWSELVRCLEFAYGDLQGMQRSDLLVRVVKIEVEIPVNVTASDSR